MRLDRVYFMCPYLDGSPKGVICNAANDLIKNIKNVDVEVCMGRRFELCYIYALKLKDIDIFPVSSSSEENKTDVTEI
jgi:hypothetical protein